MVLSQRITLKMNFEGYKMSILRANIYKQRLDGQIKVKPSTKWAYFSSGIPEVKSKLSGIVDAVNANIANKNIGGSINFCEFTAHDGILKFL